MLTFHITLFYITYTHTLHIHACPLTIAHDPLCRRSGGFKSRKNIQKVNQVEGEKIKGDTKEAADKNNMVFLFSLFYFQEHFSELETSLHNNTLRKSHCESMIWFVQPEWRLSELL